LHFLDGAGELKASRRPAVAGIGQMVDEGIDVVEARHRDPAVGLFY
jgi:hypothetical protein